MMTTMKQMPTRCPQDCLLHQRKRHLVILVDGKIKVKISSKNGYSVRLLFTQFSISVFIPRGLDWYKNDIATYLTDYQFRDISCSDRESEDERRISMIIARN